LGIFPISSSQQELKQGEHSESKKLLSFLRKVHPNIIHSKNYFLQTTLGRIPSRDSNYIEVNRKDPVISASDYLSVTLTNQWEKILTYELLLHSGEIIRYQIIRAQQHISGYDTSYTDATLSG